MIPPAFLQKFCLLLLGGWSTVALRINWQNAFCSCFNWLCAMGRGGSCFLSEEDPEDLLGCLTKEKHCNQVEKGTGVQGPDKIGYIMSCQ